MKLSYAICVCNESRDLFSLVSFLLKVKDEEDEININYVFVLKYLAFFEYY